MWSPIDDELNEFLKNELIDPSSSDDEDDLFNGAANVIIDGSVNHPGPKLVLLRDMMY